MTVAFVTVVKTESEIQLLVVATYAPDKFAVGQRIGPFENRAAAREHATVHGLSTRMPTISEVRASVSHHPYHENFFSRKLCKLHRDPAPMRVVRLEDGYIALNNGRSNWIWTGDNLKRQPT
jgi:hypothetical protein